MAMRVTLSTLQEMGRVLEELSNLQGAQIRQVEVRGHVLFLDRDHDQRGTGEYYIIGISNNPPPNQPKVMREITHTLGDQGGTFPRR